LQKAEAVQQDIEHLLFELNCCVNDLQGFRLQIQSNNLHQAELSLHKLEALVSFIKLSSRCKVVC
jgi:hypothetical protein